ncbi:mandelate racemase/muconate lactonizing enzyme family protein [Alphaproteobacteria bacterium]|nr:mandelate racemase/muconate lactonizing enzyme family protein [Alphaproteobacteria bacterium]
MKIENIELFYLSMPKILDEADGSQDALIVKVEAGGLTGWGECEASPLTSIANFICPKSHSAAKPIKSSVINKNIDNLNDVKKIIDDVKHNSLMIAQTPHTFSGIEVALLDLLAKKEKCPIYSLLGFSKTTPKIAYASVLFGETPQETFEIGKNIKNKNFRAIKFGWQNFGSDIKLDEEHMIAARDGIGKNINLMIDVGAIWGTNLEEASKRAKIFNDSNITWLEEPFFSDAFFEYSELSKLTNIPLAGGESCHSIDSAKNMIRYGKVKFIQIDAGIAGGILAGKEICDFAEKNDIQYVNHTFTSHLQLSSSLQPYANSSKSIYAEFPQQLKSLAWDLTTNHIEMDKNGHINLPADIGHGMQINEKALNKYKVDVEIHVNKKKIF